MERLRIKTDIAFKCVFGRDKKECKEALKKLLSAILNTEITEIAYKNPFNIGEYDQDKEIEFDIEVMAGGKALDIEMQLSNIPSFPERLAYYGAKLLTGTIGKGEDYTELKNSVVIGILDFELFKNKSGYYSEFCFMEKNTKTVLTEVLRIITLEMVKLKEGKSVAEMTETERWLTYLKYVGERGHEKVVEEIIKESEGVKMADTILREVSADERMRSILTSKEKYERDTLARMNFARKEGLEKGLQKGRKEGLVEGLEKGRKEGLVEGIDIGKKEGIDIGRKEVIEESTKKAIALMLNMGLDKDTILSNVATTYSLDINTLNEWCDEIDK